MNDVDPKYNTVYYISIEKYSCMFNLLLFIYNFVVEGVRVK